MSTSLSQPAPARDETFPIGKPLIWLLCLLATPIVGAILYYAWRRSHPAAARYANRAAWLSFLIWVAVVVGLQVLARRFGGEGRQTGGTDPTAMLEELKQASRWTVDGGLDPCDLVPQVDLEAIVGEDLRLEEKLRLPASGTSPAASVCGYESAPDSRGQTLSVRVASQGPMTPAAFRAEFGPKQEDAEMCAGFERDLREGKPNAAEAIAAFCSRKAVAGVGEEAYFDPPALHLLAGGSVYMVSVFRSGPALEDQTPYPELAKAIAERIRMK